MKKLSRRNFSSKMAIGAGGTLLAANLPLGLTQLKMDKKKLGVALVGLGNYSTDQLAPALQDTKNCYLAGIVTGTPQKEDVWAKKYNLPKGNIYNYENFDSIKDNDEIDVVYVVLPNAMHADFCIRAAKAGKHVICEKLMAVSVAECDQIIAACKEASVKLGVGYRLHSEPYTQQVKEFVKKKTYGDVTFVSAEAAYRSTGNPSQWRLNKELSGGGALLNMGVYAIQSAIYGTGENPISVSAQEFSTRPEYFKNTDETITAQLNFSSGAIANITTSHNFSANSMYVSGTNGWFKLQPANNYGPLSGSTSDGKKLDFPHESQQKLQMDDFAAHILYGTTNLAPGEMGKRDMIIVSAIYESIAKGGKTIALDIPENYGFST
ncbi:Gfo/Idh/MocA family protein [Flavobacterium sp. ASW18X]|uniref:Gfo/Idh/MocA family protein n=1 Tax=Flavobacterium sp. ASW18X TaxID=2572595 RepID=UPI0010AEB4CC|nr:Gfo/Idh/MocA family oxidoreductase [Flavobacterium sp. ASW18X]TKD66166.1 Gfo/Idh/MocA family oxidoreductase [Flavobacterium sp. ASW18X]